MASPKNLWQSVQDPKLEELVGECAKFKLLSNVVGDVFFATFPSEKPFSPFHERSGEHEYYLDRNAAEYLAQKVIVRDAHGEDVVAEKTRQLADLLTGDHAARITVASVHIVSALTMYAVDEVQLSGFNLTRAQRARAVQELLNEAIDRGVTAPLRMTEPTAVFANALMPAADEAQALFASLLPPSRGLSIA